MAKQPARKKKPSGRIVLRTGEALVEAEPAWSAAEPEVVIGELDGPVGAAIANLIGGQAQGHSRVFALLRGSAKTYPAEVSSCNNRKQMTHAARVVQASWMTSRRS